MYKKLIKIVNLDDDNNEIKLPTMPDPFEAMMNQYPPEYASDFSRQMQEIDRMKSPPEMVLLSSAPVPGDYISVGDNVYKVEQRFYNLSESWIEVWVRQENKQ